MFCHSIHESRYYAKVVGGFGCAASSEFQSLSKKRRYHRKHSQSVDHSLSDWYLIVVPCLIFAEENEAKIMAAGLLLPVVDLFHSNRIQIKEQAALLLSNLTCNRI